MRMGQKTVVTEMDCTRLGKSESGKSSSFCCATFIDVLIWMLPGGLALCVQTKYTGILARSITEIKPERKGDPPQVNWEFCLWILGSRPDSLPADLLMFFLSCSASYINKLLTSRTRSCFHWNQYKFCHWFQWGQGFSPAVLEGNRAGVFSA